ncbi:MAG: endonuclease domain-containing protein [Firmicutes bacterium]|nr:endonuclease domain-containing protein [Bacillota bacterium]
MSLPYNQALIEIARNLRANMTPQERKLWYGFLSKQPVRFQRQKVIGNFIVDFFCHQATLVIEIDGGQHRDEQGLAHDEERDAYLTGIGLTVVRFSNQDVDFSFKKTCDAISNFINRAR